MFSELAQTVGTLHETRTKELSTRSSFSVYA